MVANDDRRRVARALRHYAHTDIDGGLLPSLKDAAEVAGGTWRTLFLRLADLVEPDPCAEEIAAREYRSAADTIDWETGDTPRVRALRARARELEAMARERDAPPAPGASQPVDREALLELASGLEEDADRIIKAAKNARFGYGPRMGEAKHDAYEWRGIARCIRKACKVHGDGR